MVSAIDLATSKTANGGVGGEERAPIDDLFDGLWGWVPSNCTDDLSRNLSRQAIRRCFRGSRYVRPERFRVGMPNLFHAK